MKSAVLVLDVQTKMFTDSPRPFEADEVVKRINDITAQARNSGTHDKEHLSAEIIRNHHNITLSMGPTITAVATEDVEING
jgi:hypothetical protein